MISKLRKAQDSWIAKVVLGLTALSFMSLFGISGYINSAANNPTVIKVNDQIISKQEFDYQVDQEIRLARDLLGQDIEITDDLRKIVVTSLLKKNLVNMITTEASKKYKVYVSDDLVRGIIFSQVQFLDEDGTFNQDRFKYFLSRSNWSEQRYIDTIRNDLKKQYLVQLPVGNLNVPKTLKEYVAKSESQRKIFKYVTVDASKVKIDREISEEEITQIYEDFDAEFTASEARDVSFIVLSMDDIAKKAEVSEDEIKEYYQANINEFVIPETRNVLQMMFDNEEAAIEARKKVENGQDFYKVALDMAQQPKAETELDYVSQDMLLPEISEDVFKAKKGAVVGPVESELGWHILKVTDIKAGSKVDEKTVNKQIVEAIKNEKAYDTAYDTVRNVDDLIGSGLSLEDIAKDMGTKVYTAKGLKENGDVTTFPEDVALLRYNVDFIEAAFSYNADEISQVVEDDAGYVFVRVDNIQDAHILAKDEVMDKIKKIWEDSERAAIVQEIVNDVTYDLENGDKVEDVAKRYKLKSTTTSALTRAESFENLSQAQMIDIFNDDLNSPKSFEFNGYYIIAVASANAEPRKLSDDDMDVIERRLSLDLTQMASEQLIDAYGKKMDVRVKDRILGLTQ